jgi:coniferyl-aldehyde dehydrogenase
VAVPRARVDDFVAAMRRAHARLYPTVASNADYTSIATERHYRRLLALLDDARAAGAGCDRGACTPKGRRTPRASCRCTWCWAPATGCA